MIPITAVQGYGILQNQLTTAAQTDLLRLLSSTSEMSPARREALLHEAFPTVFDPYVATTSAVSASFYEEVRGMSEVKGSVQAETLDRVDPKRWHALVGWGAGASMFELGGTALITSMLTGGLSRVLSEMASDTIIGNAANERVKVGYQRVPRPGCCAFCGLIASRADIFRSESDATQVRGRGVPIESNFNADGSRKSGGQAKGIRSRGSRKIGEAYHDNCRCRGVPIFEDNYVEMQSDADKYFDAYASARNKVTDQRKAAGYQGFGDQETSTKMILAEMRKDMGIQ